MIFYIGHPDNIYIYIDGQHTLFCRFVEVPGTSQSHYCSILLVKQPVLMFSAHGYLALFPFTHAFAASCLEPYLRKCGG